MYLFCLIEQTDVLWNRYILKCNIFSLVIPIDLKFSCFFAVIMLILFVAKFGLFYKTVLI